MSDTKFKSKIRKKLADSPSGSPGDDSNIPYEHLMKYNGKSVFYSSYSQGGFAFINGSGTLKVTDMLFDIVSDTNRCTITRGAIKSIEWNEAEQSYFINQEFEFSLME